MLRADNVTLTTVEVADKSGFRRDPAEPFFLERYDAAYKAELAAFVDSMTSGTAPTPSGADGLAALRLADKAAESVETGLPVKI
jgi:myo-inositol 2-dehydrogenase/D-chiro-inositol 1-dehydrogenase